MTSWLTTHYAHPRHRKVLWHIYLKPQHREVAEGIAVGDRVFFYEHKSQKPLKDEPRHPFGAEGIVRVATVSKPSCQCYERVEYADGRTEDWHWEIPTTGEDTNGFVSRQQVLEIIGYKPGGYLRAFNAGKGVKALTVEQADALLKLFKSAASGGRGAGT